MSSTNGYTKRTAARLAHEAWRIYRSAEESGSGFVVRPSIPILFFGDSRRYLRSPLKIITVGLNPSLKEFPTHDRFSRFPAARGVYSEIVRGGRSDEYIAALNGYFCTEPYTKWFASYEAILEGAGASYYDRAESTALHTDLCSPLATDPTWGSLPRQVKADLIAAGRPLWHKLVRSLAPDLILVSVAQEHLANIAFQRLHGSQLIYAVQKKRRYEVSAIELEVVPGKTTTMVFGRTLNVPFGAFSRLEQVEIGEALKEKLSAR